MLLGHAELKPGVALRRFFFCKAFFSYLLHWWPAGIKQLSAGTEVNVGWLATLSGGSLVLTVTNHRLLGSREKVYFQQAKSVLKNGYAGRNSFIGDSAALKNE